MCSTPFGISDELTRKLDKLLCLLSVLNAFRQILEAYSKKPDYLTKQEASAVIQELDSLPSAT